MRTAILTTPAMPELRDREGPGLFIGHFAVGFASRRVAPRTSLGTFIAAALLLDLLWPIFLLLGWELEAVALGAWLLPLWAGWFDRHRAAPGGGVSAAGRPAA